MVFTIYTHAAIVTPLSNTRTNATGTNVVFVIEWDIFTLIPQKRSLRRNVHTKQRLERAQNWSTHEILGVSTCKSG